MNATRPEAVRWGCREHGTPPGTPCDHCANQGELFARAEGGRLARRRAGQVTEIEARP